MISVVKKEERRDFNKFKIAIGFASLILGILFYIVDRQQDQIYFLKIVNFYFPELHSNFYNIVFGRFSKCLPTLIHVFSFSLITSALLSCNKLMSFLICIFWLIINLIFEFGQKYKGIYVSIIPKWFESIPFLNNTRNYFQYGYFSTLDCFSICLGGLFSILVISIFDERRT